MSRLRRRVVLGLSAVTVVTLATATPALADKGWHGKPPTDLPKVPLMVGSGGAVSSVDRDATPIGIEMLGRAATPSTRRCATAALGVTEPYCSGIGGGGYLVYYDAEAPGLHHRRPRDGADRRSRRPPSSIRPVRRWPSPPWSPPGAPSAPRHPRPVGQDRLARAGRGRCASCSSPPRAWPARVPRRPDLPLPDGRPTRPTSARSRPPSRSSCPVTRRRWSATPFATPKWPARTRSWAPRGRRDLPRRDRARWSAPRRRPPSTTSRRERHPRTADPRRPRGVPRPYKAPITSQYNGLDVYGCPRRARAASPSPRRSTSSRRTRRRPGPA